MHRIALRNGVEHVARGQGDQCPLDRAAFVALAVVDRFRKLGRTALDVNLLGANVGNDLYIRINVGINVGVTLASKAALSLDSKDTGEGNPVALFWLANIAEIDACAKAVRSSARPTEYAPRVTIHKLFVLGFPSATSSLTR